MGQDTVRAGTFWGVLNVSLCAFGAQLGLNSVDKMLLQFWRVHFGRVHLILGHWRYTHT